VRDFPHLSRLALGPTRPPVKWVPGLSRGKQRPECDADSSPSSSAVVIPLWAVRPVHSLSACTKVHFTLPFYMRYSFFKVMAPRFWGIGLQGFDGVAP